MSYVKFPAKWAAEDDRGGSPVLHKSLSGTQFTKTLRQMHVREYEDRHKAADRALSRKDAEAIVPVLRQCLEVSETIGRDESHDWAFDQLGRCLGKIGKHEDSLECHKAELGVALKFGNRVEEGHACCNVARAYAGLLKYVGIRCDFPCSGCWS